MSPSVALAVVWVFAATGVAMLPMRLQYVPGSILLVCAPLIIGYLGYQFGWVAGLGGLAAFLSMFRKPLRHFWRKARGLETEIPQ